MKLDIANGQLVQFNNEECSIRYIGNDYVILENETGNIYRVSFEDLQKSNEDLVVEEEEKDWEGIFLAFLEEKEAKEGFMKGLETNNPRNITLDDIVRLVRPMFWVGCAFSWAKTEEGKDYWKAMEIAWLERMAEEIGLL